MKVGIFCAQGCEECEALLVYDLIYRTGIEVDLIGLNQYDITSSHNLTFKTNKIMKDVDIKEYDCIVLPGGDPGAMNLERSDAVQEAIDYFMANNKLIAALCSAPSILIHKGLLDHGQFTCFPGCECNKRSLKVKAYKYQNIITGNGLGGTIEFASMITENLLGKEKADEILKRIQYI